MPFKQNNKTPDALWRKRSRPLLIAAGLPEAVIDDERRWRYLLDHGVDDFHTGWTPQEITMQQVADMLSLLAAHYGNEADFELLRTLRRRSDEN
ncbi:MAG: hypothetical protein LBE21_00585 [Pseudomonadales bacterium]|nr:hypothetical protein [Pseudomonadales bacterium]